MLRKKEKKKRKNNGQLIIIGFLFLIIGGISIIGFKYYQNYKKNNIEQQQIDKFIEVQRDIEITHDIDGTTEEKPIEEAKEEVKENIVQNEENFIAVIEIPKINLRKGIYSKESSKNNVNKNIEILKESDMPDKNNGNFILAGHSGNSRIAYFKNLSKLENNDIAYIYYNGGRYVYKLVNSYEIEKTGEATINRNGQKNTLTLITCKHNTNKQIVFIFELMKDGEYNG